jgi:parvulin-like peptidyl-prolyl isomerase
MAAFLSVNGREVSVEHAVREALLDQQGRTFAAALIDAELIRQHAEAIGIAVSVEELQEAADEMRYERGLTDRARALEWVAAHGQTLESLEGAIELLLLRNKLASAIPDAEIDAYYQAHREALEYVVLFSIRAPSEAEAFALRARVEAGEPFPVVAADASCDVSTRRTAGFVGRLRRAEMSADIARAVFGAPIGVPIGPLATEQGFNLFLAAARRVPSVEEESAGIRLLLFEELLAQLRAAADVRWPLIDQQEVRT